MKTIAEAKPHAWPHHSMDLSELSPLSGEAAHASEAEPMPTINPLSPDLGQLTDEDLKKFALAGALKSINVFRLESGKYRIVVSLTWKTGDYLLITYRKKPREWASLDRLMKHVEANYGDISNFSLSIKTRPPSK
ncbi:hypothetical protein [Xenophilus azovorans]|uniref:hypothetical protein n=1 Tax=Xenophilus azovorans TaxID=151755 RepID=UPI0012ED59A3|nr:hypothetical protein [Xenophilus azovorans]